ncbi:Hypothetical protein, putative [Bodo saltans]|uniref:Uncharacterized protein n=1 Tax=Bodo saltans TaxID=75058 RepID=A0A0S4JJ11_BODSA|nr:Hypothetical protein, putative [Bodo saltans]|eukprot:CUG88405.1 Hypothetical protein, putative [Bodo saltans]
MFSETPIAAETIRAMCRHDNDGHRELSVPNLEWEGIYDRAAFGTPEAMLLYGLRGLRLRAFIDGGGHVSAEPYLFRYLCENEVVIHIAPWMLRRIRADGSIEGRDINKAILSDRFVLFTDLWRDLQLRQHSKYSKVNKTKHSGSEKMRGCLPRALWGLPHVTSDAVKS